LFADVINHLPPIYHEAKYLQFSSKKGIQHNTKQQTAQELHAEAWAIVGPQLKQTSKKRSITIMSHRWQRIKRLEEVIQAFMVVEQLLFRSACKMGTF